jgi:hypothetical protein
MSTLLLQQLSDVGAGQTEHFKVARNSVNTLRKVLSWRPRPASPKRRLLQTPGGYALLYRRENGNRVLDVVELDSEGVASRVRAYYESDQA